MSFSTARSSAAEDGAVSLHSPRTDGSATRTRKLDLSPQSCFSQPSSYQPLRTWPITTVALSVCRPASQGRLRMKQTTMIHHPTSCPELQALIGRGVIRTSPPTGSMGERRRTMMRRGRRTR
ncbi:unnamed protein product [Ectocarpus fasciculatus]